MYKTREFPDSQHLLFLKLKKVVSVKKQKKFSARVFSEYDEICKILNILKIANMVILVETTCTIMVFVLLGTTLCPTMSIATPHIHEKLSLTHLILAKVLQQPILDPTGFWIIKDTAP